MRVKQEIDSLFQNLAWETDPDWPEKMAAINRKISHFWKEILERAPNSFSDDF